MRFFVRKYSICSILPQKSFLSIQTYARFLQPFCICLKIFIVCFCAIFNQIYSNLNQIESMLSIKLNIPRQLQHSNCKCPKHLKHSWQHEQFLLSHLQLCVNIHLDTIDAQTCSLHEYDRCTETISSSAVNAVRLSILLQSVAIFLLLKKNEINF